MLTGTLVPSALPAPPTSRPNVLLIITDQQRADMLSCAGNPYVKTPAVDSLAESGVRFGMAYCANPVCSPSRFSMLTGVMPSRIGMDRNMDIRPSRTGDELLHCALGRVFREAGYETVYGGKTHLPMRDVKAYSFNYLTPNEREGLANACAKFLGQPHDRPFLLVASFINPHDICYMAIEAAARGTGKPPAVQAGAAEDLAPSEAMRLPQGISREEFFGRLCPPLPANHGIPQGEPPVVRQGDWRSFRQYVAQHWTDEEWRLHRWTYARLVERADAQIGKVLAALRSAGLEEKTLVVFTSDHGDMDAAHKLEHKAMPYEEAMHVPLVARWKGVIPAGRVDTTHIVSTGLDLIPTLCDFAGVPVPQSLKGRSVKPLAVGEGQVESWRHDLVIENEASRIFTRSAVQICRLRSWRAANSSWTCKTTRARCTTWRRTPNTTTCWPTIAQGCRSGIGSTVKRWTRSLHGKPTPTPHAPRPTLPRLFPLRHVRRRVSPTSFSSWPINGVPRPSAAWAIRTQKRPISTASRLKA